MHVDHFLDLVRTELGPDVTVTPEVEAIALSLMHVGRDGRIRPRLSRANHLRILRGLWAQDAFDLLRRVRVPTLVLAARSTADDGFMRAKRAAEAQVRSIGGPVRFEWIDGVHDVPLQHPVELADRIARFARRAGRMGPWSRSS